MVPGPAFQMIYGSSGACTDCDFTSNSGSSFVTHAAAGVCTRCRWGGYAAPKFLGLLPNRERCIRVYKEAPGYRPASLAVARAPALAVRVMSPIVEFRLSPVPLSPRLFTVKLV